MTATLPPYKPQRPLGILPASIAISLLFTPALLKIGMDLREHFSLAGEFESRRTLILSRIDSAVDNQDLKTLNRINSKYGGCVTDGTFQSAIREALAKVTAREAEMELAVSRHLDLVRHQEESSPTFDPEKPQLPADKQPVDQPLSRLPR